MKERRSFTPRSIFRLDRRKIDFLKEGFNIVSLRYRPFDELYNLVETTSSKKLQNKKVCHICPAFMPQCFPQF